MSDVKLTKDADRLACQIYIEYCDRRYNGADKSDSRLFDSDWPDIITANENRTDAMDTLEELCRALPQTKSYIDGSFELGDDLIIYMENRFPGMAGKVLDYLAKTFGIILSFPWGR